MVPDPATSCLGLEYFCFEGDNLWEMKDEALIRQAGDELVYLGLIDRSAILDGTVLRMPKAYPVYDATYQRGITGIRKFLESVPNLQLVGRNGMHRYNNQDHSMLTAVLAARNICGAHYDLWRVNADTEYSEEGQEITERELEQMQATQPSVPQRLTAGAGR